MIREMRSFPDTSVGVYSRCCALSTEKIANVFGDGGLSMPFVLGYIKVLKPHRFGRRGSRRVCD
jgi:hypothetical protein